MCQFVAQFPELTGQVCCAGMDVGGNAGEAFRTMIDPVEGCHDGQQGLGRADI